MATPTGDERFDSVTEQEIQEVLAEMGYEATDEALRQMRLGESF